MSSNWLSLRQAVNRHRTQVAILAGVTLLLLFALGGMSGGDWVITVLRGLAVGAVVFLVAAGFSLIFGLMDVLNLAHGALFMIGAYVGWTVYVRPDTAIDVITPLLLLAAGFGWIPLWQALLARVHLTSGARRAVPWAGLALALALFAFSASRYPIAIWNPDVYDASPMVYALAMESGQEVIAQAPQVDVVTAALSMAGVLLAGSLAAASVALVGHGQSRQPRTGANRRVFALGLALALTGVAVYALNEPLTRIIFELNTTWRFLIAVTAAVASGFFLGGLMEMTLIRPLYLRPIYQLMLTLGLAVMIREVVITIWGRTQITMPKPALFAGTGAGCPAQNISDLLAHQCSTISFLGTRIRTYNEIFVIVVGLIVLIAIWLLLRRTRIGMIIRAGVQDRQMVEALGINVRRVFTFVFALGVGLATLGGVLAGPSLGISDDMGESLLLLALIALAIGGLTSYPGAAVGAVLVGLLQQFIIKYGQVGIQLPFMTEPLKPSPPLVPASAVLLMVVVLLLLPNGLFGRRE